MAWKRRRKAVVDPYYVKVYLSQEMVEHDDQAVIEEWVADRALGAYRQGRDQYLEGRIMAWNSRVLEAFSRSRRKKRKHKRSTVEQATKAPGELRKVRRGEA